MAQSHEKLAQMRSQLSSMDLGCVKECILLTRRAIDGHASRRMSFRLHNKLWPGRVMEDLDAKRRNIYELHTAASESAAAKLEAEDEGKKVPARPCRREIAERAPAGITLISGLAGFGFIGGKKQAGAKARAGGPA